MKCLFLLNSQVLLDRIPQRIRFRRLQMRLRIFQPAFSQRKLSVNHIALDATTAALLASKKPSYQHCGNSEAARSLFLQLVNNFQGNTQLHTF